VRERDADVSIERRTRKATPRIAFTPGHALAAILLLVAVTCTSLTLLVRQSLNYAEAGRASAGRSSVQTYEAQQAESSDGTQSSGRLSLQGQSGSGNEEETNWQSAGGQDESSEPSGSAQTEQPQAQANGGLINLNTATLEELDSINGIGPVTAQKILDHRKRIGRFSSVDQLLEVSGIGTKTLEKMGARKPGLRASARRHGGVGLGAGRRPAVRGSRGGGVRTIGLRRVGYAGRIAVDTGRMRFPCGASHGPATLTDVSLRSGSAQYGDGGNRGHRRRHGVVMGMAVHALA